MITLNFNSGKSINSTDELINNSVENILTNQNKASELNFSSDAYKHINASRIYTDRQIELSEKYNIPLGTIGDIQADLEKNIARNQSGWEQLGRSIGQIVVNEVLIGSVLGLSDLVDSAINIGKSYGEDDWTNPLSSYLTEKQDELKEQWTIYRENPNKSFDITDSAWWWDNFVSVGSSVSLMLPSLGVTKALGAVGKIAKLATTGTKFDRGLYKATRWMAKTAGAKYPDTFAKTLENFTKSAIPATISRQMEDMLEARETYNDTKDKVSNELKRLHESGNEKELQEFYDRNQIFHNEDGSVWDDEKIANYIADKAATYTFVNDFKYIGFDVLQFNNILRFGKKPLTLGTKKVQDDILRKMAVGTEKAAEEILEKGNYIGTINENLKNALKFYAKNPRIALKNLAETTELTEGIEEMGQGITQDNAKVQYEKYFNPNYTYRTIASQLSDSQLWEQGVWGMIGGMTFKAAGKGLQKLGNAYYVHKNKDKLSEQDIAKLENQEEYIRQQDINSRLTDAETLEAKLHLWKKGYNPNQKVYDKDGKEIEVDYADESQFTKMQENEKEAVYNEIVNDYLTNMVLRAVDVGNGELLESFLEDENFDKYIERISEDTEDVKKLKSTLLENYKNIKNEYYKNLETVFGSLDIQSEYVGKQIASFMTRNSIQIKSLEDEISRLDADILKNTDIEHKNNYLERRRLGKVNVEIGKFLDSQNKLKEALDKKQINKTQYNAKIKEIDKILNELYKIGDLQTQYSEAYNKALGNLKEDISSDLSKTNDEIGKAFAEVSKTRVDALNKELKDIGEIPDVSKESANRKIYAEIQLAIAKGLKISSQQDLEDAYADNMAAQISIIENRFNGAAKKINDYIINSKNPEEAYNSLFDGTAPKNIQDDFDLFKIGNDAYEYYSQIFKLAANAEQLKKESKVKPENIDNVQKTPLNDNANEEQKITITTDEKRNSQNISDPLQTNTEKNKHISPSTGEQINEKEVKSNISLEEETVENEVFVEEQTYNEDDIKNTGIIDKIILRKLSKIPSEIAIGIRTNGVHGEEFNNFINDIYEELKNNPITKDYKEEDLKYTIQETFAKILEVSLPNLSIEQQKVYKKLIDDIRGITRPAETRLITVEDELNSVEKLITNYVKEKVNFKDKNGKPIIDLDDLLKYIVFNYKNNIMDIANDIIYILSNDINSENPKYSIVNSQLIGQYKDSPSNFLQHLLYLKNVKPISTETEHTEFHMQFPNKVFNYIKYHNLLKKGYDNIKAAELAFNVKYKTTVHNNGVENVVENNLQKLIDESYIEYKNWTKAYELSQNSKLYVYRIGKAYQIRVHDETVNLKDLGDEEHSNLQLAYLSRVISVPINGKTTNTCFIKAYDSKTYGMLYKVWEDETGIHSNFDKLFEDLIFSEKGSEIYKYIIDRKTEFSKKELEELHEFFKDYLNTKEGEEHPDIILKGYNGKSLTEDQANYLLNNQLYEVYYNAKDRLGQESIVESFETYKSKLYDNYKQLYRLEELYNKNEKNGEYTTLTVYDIPFLHISVAKSSSLMKIDYDYLRRNNIDINNAKFTYIDSDNRVHRTDDSESYDNIINYHYGSIGIILKDKDNEYAEPLISWISTTSKVEKGNIFYNLLRETLKQLISHTYEEGKTDKSIKDLLESIKDLIGNNSPFYIKKSKNYKSFIEELRDIINNTKDYSDDIVNSIMDKIEFNRSISLIKGKIDKTNKYFDIDSTDKFTIKLFDGNDIKIITYNNYIEFILSNGAFTTYDYLSTKDDAQNTILMSSEVSNIPKKISPVKGKDKIKDYNNTKKALYNLSDDDRIETRDLLKLAGFSDDEISIALGDKSNISILDKYVGFDKTSSGKEYAYFHKDNKYIKVTTKLFEEIDNGKNKLKDIENFKYNLVRLLIHENIHKGFDKLSKEDKQIAINHLKNIFISFGEALIDDIDNKKDNKLAKAIQEGFKNTIWKYENIKDLVKKLKANELTTEQAEDWMNEFLAESLSQKVLIEYLSSKEYNGITIDTSQYDNSKDSIWDKIVDLIVRFFDKIYENFSLNNLDNSKKSSIFAEEYKLLSILGKDKIITEKESKVIKNNPIPKGIQLTIDFENSNNIEKESKEEGKKETEKIDLDDLTNEDLTEYSSEYEDMEKQDEYRTEIQGASTKLITEFDVRAEISDKNGNFDNSGLQKVSDMNNFIKGFKYKEQAKISSLLNSNGIEYACK